MVLIKKKIYLFIFLLVNVAPFLYGMKRSTGFSDVRSSQSQKSKLPRGLVKGIFLDADGSVVIGCEIKNPQMQIFTFRDEKDLLLYERKMEDFPKKFKKNFKRYVRGKIKDRERAARREARKHKKIEDEDSGKYLIIYPEKYSTEPFNILNSQIVINLFVKGAPPELIKFLSKCSLPPELIKFLSKYSLEDKEEERLKKELIFQKRRKEEAIEKLKNQRESLKETTEYFKQITLLQRCLPVT